jgi:hypothetical protein
MASSGMLRRVALVRTGVLEELGASIMRVTRIGELGTTLDVTSNVPSSPILVTLKWRCQVPPKRRFLQEPHGVLSQKTPFSLIMLVTPVTLRSWNCSNLHLCCSLHCLDRPPVEQPLTAFLAFYETRRSITAFTRTHQLSLS